MRNVAVTVAEPALALTTSPAVSGSIFPDNSARSNPMASMTVVLPDPFCP